MHFDIHLPQWRIDQMRAEGRWQGKIITDYMDEAVANTPDAVAITDVNSSTGRRTTLSYRQLRTVSDRMACALAAMGVRKGDIVSCQLPNWWQVGALYLAAVRIGAAMNPLMPWITKSYPASRARGPVWPKPVIEQYTRRGLAIARLV